MGKSACHVQASPFPFRGGMSFPSMLSLCAIAFFGPAACTRRLREYESVVYEDDMDSKAITIMMEAAFPPYNSFHPVDGLVGFDVELVPMVCAAAGLQCSVVTAPLTNAWPGKAEGYMGKGFLNRQ